MAQIHGQPIDESTRCVHWHGPLDIVAFRFACCSGWWPCHTCHDDATQHQAQVWPLSRANEPAALCGACGHQMTPRAYMGSASACPACGAGFNPACRSHWDRYFEVGPGT